MCKICPGIFQKNCEKVQILLHALKGNDRKRGTLQQIREQQRLEIKGERQIKNPFVCI